MLDKELIKRRFGKAIGGYSAHADVQRMVAFRLMDMVEAYIGGMLHDTGNVLEIGCGDGLLTRLLVERLEPACMTVNDICPSAADFAGALPGVVFMPGDAEQIALPCNQDMVVSGSTVQWFADLPGFIAKAALALKDGGILAFSTFGPDNLKEVSALAGNGLEYYGTGALEDMLSAHFRDVSVVEDHIAVRFNSPADVLRHLKDTGVTGVKREQWTRGRYMDFVRRYSELFGDADGVTLTWHPVWAIAR